MLSVKHLLTLSYLKSMTKFFRYTRCLLALIQSQHFGSQIFYLKYEVYKRVTKSLYYPGLQLLLPEKLLREISTFQPKGNYLTLIITINNIESISLLISFSVQPSCTCVSHSIYTWPTPADPASLRLL